MRVRYSYVKRLIEAAVQSSEALASGLALVKIQRGALMYEYILYDPNQMITLLKKMKWRSMGIMDRHDALQDCMRLCVVGVIGLEHADQRTGPSWGAVMVNMSAAKKGYGPLMYDIAMSDNYVMSDRWSVSPSARAVWDAYLLYRNDVKHKPLDDINNPKTPQPIDDAVYQDDESLNNVYKRVNPIDTSALQANHKKAIDAIIKLLFKFDYQADVLERTLLRAAHEFFHEYYAS